MAGPQDIQRFPKGLIDLLGMRATGETPAQLAQQVISNIEVLDLYLLDRLSTFQISTAAITATGNVLFPNTTVPNGEIWWVYELSYQLPSLAAATSLQTNLCVYRSQASTNLPLALGPAQTTPALFGNQWGIHFENPLIMTAGQSVGIYTSQITGAPGSAPQLTMHFARAGG
jgi:hypothetical protein